MNDNKRKKSLLIIGVIILVIIGGLYLYTHNVHIHLNPDNGIYYAKYNGASFYLVFEDGDLYTIMSDEYCTKIGKITYNYSGEYWKRLVGNLYFSDDGLFSLTNVPSGAHPAYIKMICEKSYLVDMDQGTTLIEDTKSEGESSDSLIYFYDDRIVFDDLLMSKVDEIHPTLKEMVRVLIDYQSGH